MSRSTTTLDQPRYAAWVRASKSVKNIEAGLIPFIEGLGKIDASLVGEDAAFSALSSEARGSFAESLKLTDRFTLSILWVFGGYEVVRTISQRVRTNPRLLSKRLARRVDTTKRHFERVRVVLAKFEPSARHRSTDFSVARPALDHGLGISWKVANRVIIPRRRLSDRLLKLLDALK